MDADPPSVEMAIGEAEGCEEKGGTETAEAEYAGDDANTGHDYEFAAASSASATPTLTQVEG
jgi:hypothetical protein